MNGLTKVDTVALKEKKKPKTKMAINRFETVNCLRKKNCRRKKKKKIPSLPNEPHLYFL